MDHVESYFALRKVALRVDASKHLRIYLNDRYTYNLGVLDQGFWPDGLYTAPADEALAFDNRTMKSMGFNTVRWPPAHTAGRRPGRTSAVAGG